MKFPKYNNADICKDQILSDNKNKSGIYMFTNKKNKKKYIDYFDLLFTYSNTALLLKFYL